MHQLMSLIETGENKKNLSWNIIQAGLVLHHGYIPEKCCAN